MRLSSLTVAAALLALSSGAAASTLVDLVPVAEVLYIGEYDESAGTLELILRFDRVDMDLSATDYFADSFMEYEGSSKMRINLEGITGVEAAALAEGSMINVHYFHVSGLYSSGEGYCSETWTFLEERDDVYEVPNTDTICTL